MQRLDGMNKAIGFALLAAGIALVIFGINASESFSSDVSRFFTGHPTDKSMWMLIGGIAALVLGSVLSFRKSLT
jgi:divalent metal cation (Fe/Co/Zn/Cd) transporter